MSMRGFFLFFLTLYFPLVTHLPAAAPLSNVDPEVARYAIEVQAVWQSYRSVANDLSAIITDVLQNPLYFRQPDFTQDVKLVTKRIRQITNILAAVHSPAAVESIHEELVLASDTFDAAAFMLDRFAGTHDFDDFADGYELLVAGLTRWQLAIDRLAELLGTPVQALQAQELETTRHVHSLATYSE
jgi:hypothetical protein